MATSEFSKDSAMDGQQPFSQRNLNLPLKKVEVEKLIGGPKEEEDEVHFIRQYVNEVLDFSSQYGSDTSISYTAYNLTGKPSKYPEYGDFPQAFVMKTYGNWWKQTPSYSPEYMPQNTPKITSTDYVDVAFEQKVYPFSVNIYETYNPGSVVRIWAKNDASIKKRWALLWEGEPVMVSPHSRIFSPTIKLINFKTSVLRIEFNHSKLEYYTGIEGILLVGSEQIIRTNVSSSMKFHNGNINENGEISIPIKLGKITQQVMELNLHNTPREKVDLQAIVAEFSKKKSNFEHQKSESDHSGRFQHLPNETILKILSYLDLPNLLRCAQLNRHFSALCNDGLLFRKLSLRPYWSRLHDEGLLGLTAKCQYLQKLDLSWCGSYNMITNTVFKRFVTACCKNLTHIRLNCCKFVTDCAIKSLTETSSQLKEIELRNCSAINEIGFFYLTNLSTLERLDFYRTEITNSALIAILKANTRLLHLNIGSCLKLSNMDEVALALARFNNKLVSVDFCRTPNLTQFGITALSHCPLLEEIDIGWCLGFHLPEDSLAFLAEGCPRLKKLFLTALRGIADKDLQPVLKYCRNLEQLDLVGIRGITSNIVVRILHELPKLRLLDLSFCNSLTDSQVMGWKYTFTRVAIKRSYSTPCSTYFHRQHFYH